MCILYPTLINLYAFVTTAWRRYRKQTKKKNMNDRTLRDVGSIPRLFALLLESGLPFAVHRLLMLYQDLGHTGQELRETQS